MIRNEKMTYLRVVKRVIIYCLIILLYCLNPVFAHNTSWNKAVVTITGNTLNLTLRMVQIDLLGALIPDIDSTVTLSQKEWEAIVPKAQTYVFSNTALLINGKQPARGNQNSWRLENDPPPVNDVMDTLMGVIEFSRTWHIDTPPKTLNLTLDLLEHVEIPVKWVVLIFSDNLRGKKLYQVINRGETASYDFTRQVWLDGEGNLLSGGDESTLWGRLRQFVRIGFNHISLEKIFESTENPKVLILYLLLAIVIGAFHSLSPGHGKALIGAYIIGNKGTVGDAVVLGIVTAASHTVSVLILGVILLIAFDAVVPDNIASYLNAVSGLIILVIGAYLFNRRFREIRHTRHDHTHDSHAPHTHAHTDHPHADHEHHTHSTHAHTHEPHSHHSHDDHHSHHGHGHDHEHITMESIQKKGIWTNVMMGISGGMVPCPTALVVLFLAISVNQLALGLMLIVFFSFGLAATLTGLGILFAKGSTLIDKYDNNRIVPKLPLVSAGIIVVLGCGIMIRALLSLT